MHIYIYILIVIRSCTYERKHTYEIHIYERSYILYMKPLERVHTEQLRVYEYYALLKIY